MEVETANDEEEGEGEEEGRSYPLSQLPQGNTNPLGCYIASRPIGLFLLTLRQVRKLRIHEGNTGLRDSKGEG